MSSLALTGCGKAPITLNAKTFILEQGNSMPTEASVYVKGKSEDVAKTVLNADGVDYNTVGTYTAELVHPDKTLKIEVKVVDTTAPAVELYADEFSVAPGQMLSITDVVKSMSDNSSVTIGFADDITKADADKTLNQSVVYPEAGAYSSEICAKDAYGNMTVLPIVIMVVNDSEPPVLSGVNSTVYATVGNAVDILANVTATDNIDGDITSRVTADTSAVDFNTAGTYTAVISVKDGSGNETSEEVSVVVQDPSASLNSGQLSQLERILIRTHQSMCHLGSVLRWMRITDLRDFSGILTDMASIQLILYSRRAIISILRWMRAMSTDLQREYWTHSRRRMSRLCSL